MNLPKIAASLGFILIFSVILTGCGGGGSTPKPPASPPTIQTLLLPQGAVNVAYGTNGGAAISATGGTPPYTWSISSGSLPPGLTLNSGGVISGTPTTLGNYPFTAKVTDATGLSATQNLSIYVEGVVSITTTLLPSGSLGVPYSQMLTASGGLAPYTWCVLAGSPATCDSTQANLPAGLSLNTATGVISGTPTTNGPPTNFTVQVTDSEMPPGAPATGSSGFTITIMSITTTSLPSGYINVPYSGTLTVAGGSSPYSWKPISLPPGLSLDPACTGTKLTTCAIKGTPTTGGVFAVTVQVSDGEKANPAVATATVSLTIYNGSPLVVTTTTLPAGIVGIHYSTTLAASGGTLPYTWSVATGSLPSGLSLDPNSGVISGTPTAANTFSFTVQVADSGSPQQMANSGQLTINIKPPLTNASLKGNYAFTLSGYKNGSLVVMAGAFVADGNGGFTAGVLDLNDGSGESGGGNPVPQHVVLAQSSYSIQPNGLGTMILVTDFPATYNFSIAIRSDGSGSLIEDNMDPAERGSGAMKKQSPTDFVTTSLNGNFAVGFFGVDPAASRYAGAGEFVITNGQGDINSGVVDIDDAGSAQSGTFLGTFSTGIDPSTGRGTSVNLTFNGDHGHVFVYAYYIVNQKELILVSTNEVQAGSPYPLTLWSALRQLHSATGFDNTVLLGISVDELNALDTNGAADVTTGLFTGQGVSAHTCQSKNYDSATFSFDENQGGTCNGGSCSQPQSSQGTYCVDNTTGRVTLTPFNTGPFTAPPVFYMVQANHGFVVGTDSAVTSGYFEAQSAAPFANSSIGGSYAGGTVTPVLPQITDAVAWLLADGSGNVNGTEYTSGPAGAGGPLPLNYTYAVDSTGRAVVQQKGTPIGVAYVISPTNFVLLPTTDPNPALSIFGQ